MKQIKRCWIVSNVTILLKGIATARQWPPWAPETWSGKDDGTDNWDSIDSSGFTFERPWDTFTSGATSKEAQLLSSEFVGFTIWATVVCVAWGIAGAIGGSGTSSKSIRLLIVSSLTSDGVPLLDAKLLEDAVLCNYSSQRYDKMFRIENQFWELQKEPQQPKRAFFPLGGWDTIMIPRKSYLVMERKTKPLKKLDSKERKYGVKFMKVPSKYRATLLRTSLI